MLPHFLAEMYRGISLNRLELYPEVREVLDDAASAITAWPPCPTPNRPGPCRNCGPWAWTATSFPIVVSGDLGYRKPDPRIFALALRRLHLPASEVVFVGNDMFRDVYGARQAGLRTVFFATNQGQQRMDGVEAHYNIYRFGELRKRLALFRATVTSLGRGEKTASGGQLGRAAWTRRGAAPSPRRTTEHRPPGPSGSFRLVGRINAKGRGHQAAFALRSGRGPGGG